MRRITLQTWVFSALRRAQVSKSFNFIIVKNNYMGIIGSAIGGSLGIGASIFGGGVHLRL